MHNLVTAMVVHVSRLVYTCENFELWCFIVKWFIINRRYLSFIREFHDGGYKRKLLAFTFLCLTTYKELRRATVWWSHLFLATAKSTSTQCCHIICHCVAFIAHSSTQLLCCCYRVALLAHSPIDHTARVYWFKHKDVSAIFGKWSKYFAVPCFWFHAFMKCTWLDHLWHHHRCPN